MTGADVLARLHRAGIAIGWDAEGLTLRALASALAPALAEEAKRGIEGLRALLAEEARALGAQRVWTAPLSREQERLWFRRAVSEARDSLLIVLALRFASDAPAPPYPDALAVAAARHPVLGALFRDGPGEPYMLFTEPPRAPEELVVDLRGLTPAAARPVLDRALLADVHRPLDLAQTPGLRTLRVFEPGGAVVLQITRHHLVSDGWSLGLLLRDIAEAARLLRAGRPPAPRQRALLYAEHACRQRAPRPDRSALPTALRGRSLRMLGSRQSGGRAHVLRGLLEAGTVSEVCRQRRLTHFAVTCGVFALVLGAVLSRREVAFGIDVSTRDRPELETCIGTFVNRVPLLIEPPTEGPLGAYLDAIGAQASRAAADGAVPFEDLVAAADPPRDDAYDPLIDIIFGLHAEPRHAPYRHLGPVAPIEVEDAATHVPLSVYLTADGPSFYTEIRYDDGYISGAAVRGFLRAFGAAISALGDAPRDDVAALRRRAIAALRLPTRAGARLRRTSEDREGIP